MSENPVHHRKIRIVCISDTHNASPEDGCFKLPPGDVLIHAGDLTNQGTLHELRKTLEWIDAADYEAKIVIAGNHDVTLDGAYYENNSDRFHSRYPQDSAACAALISTFQSITYLNHSSTTVRLRKLDVAHPGVEFTVFGSPCSSGDGYWAFTYDASGTFMGRGDPQKDIGNSEEGEEREKDMASNRLWDAIPTGTDVVVTHTPPFGICDAGRQDRSCGALRKALQRARPRLAVCGHIHEGWGAEVVSWPPGEEGKDGNATTEASEVLSRTVELPRSGKKLAKIDLSRELQDDYEREALANGSHVDVPDNVGQTVEQDVSGRKLEPVSSRRRSTCVVNAAMKAKSRGADSEGPKYNKAISVDINIKLSV